MYTLSTWHNSRSMVDSQYVPNEWLQRMSESQQSSCSHGCVTTCEEYRLQVVRSVIFFPIFLYLNPSILNQKKAFYV